MAQRGRPRHPDILTPREWEVLALVREGLSNPQIGERLSISADAAKYHVSEILSKLGVSTREAAAAWRPEPPVVPVLRTVWTRALQVAALAGAVVALAGVGLLAWGVLRSSEEDGGVSNTGTATVGPSGSPVPTGAPIVVLEPVELPTTLALIVETGCWSCEGPEQSFVRVYRGSGGEYVSEKLVDAEQLGGISIRTHLFDEYGRRALLGVCMQGDCGGVDPASTDSVVEAFVSTDGGVTWQSQGQLPYGSYPVGFLGDQAVLRHVTPGPESGEKTKDLRIEYQTFPNGEALAPPGGDDTLQPFAVGGELLWVSYDGQLMRGDGAELLTLPGLSDNPQVSVQSMLGDVKSGLAVVWVDGGPRVTPPYQVAIISEGPDGDAIIENHYAVDGLFYGAAWLSKQGTLVANSGTVSGSGTPQPVLVDPYAGELRPLLHPFDDPDFVEPNMRNLVRAVLSAGQFAKVTGTGSCLNVRAAPAPDAEVLECMADGVLLNSLGPVVEEVWLEVVTPAGTIGYASLEFLEVPAD